MMGFLVSLLVFAYLVELNKDSFNPMSGSKSKENQPIEVAVFNNTFNANWIAFIKLSIEFDTESRRDSIVVIKALSPLFNTEWNPEKRRFSSVFWSWAW